MTNKECIGDRALKQFLGKGDLIRVYYVTVRQIWVSFFFKADFNMFREKVNVLERTVTHKDG